MRHDALRASLRCLTFFICGVAGVVATAGDNDRRGARDDGREQHPAYDGRVPEPGLDSRQQRESRDEMRGGTDRREQQTMQGPQQQTDNGRRNGRMSPEDRRALRRQIDQASHDLYEPRK
ncbi:MAG: hypothetical protein NVSMB6_05590 [Burkholderiaceae bacterium]